MFLEKQHTQRGKNREIQVVPTIDKVPHKTLRSSTTIGGATETNELLFFCTEEDQKQHTGKKEKQREKRELVRFRCSSNTLHTLLFSLYYGGLIVVILHNRLGGY